MSNKFVALNDDLYSYAKKHASPGNVVLDELAAVTEKHPKAVMKSDVIQMRLLSFIIKASEIKTVLELGTFTGFGTLAFALSIEDDGRVITCDVNEDFVSIGRPFWKKAGVEQKIDVRLKPALESLDDFKKEGVKIDFVYVDADKENYPNYFHKLMELVPSGAIICFDNTLWSGDVISEGTEPETEAIRTLNKLAAIDARVETTLLPIADGLSIMVKK